MAESSLKLFSQFRAVFKDNTELLEILDASEARLIKESSHELKDGFAPTDVGNAQRFAALVRGRAHYVSEWKSWVIYQAGVWQVDKEALQVTRAFQKIAVNLRTLSGSDDLTKDECTALRVQADRCETERSIQSALRLARSYLGKSAKDFDRQIDKLNVANGTLDLRTGQLLPPRPEDYFTIQAPVNYDPTAECPNFMGGLALWQPNEAERVYLQQIAGTCLTGHNVRYMFVNVGGGRNGKSTFFTALKNVLGDYATEADKSLLVQTRNEQHRTIFMTLRGKRLVLTKESESGDRLAEATVKALTGKDDIIGQFKYRDEEQFTPTHTLISHSNNMFLVRGYDAAIWDRIRPIRWEARFVPGQNDDAQFPAKLNAEASGILNWMLEGAKAWYDAGMQLYEPESIQQATESYRQDQDHVGRFLEQVCEVGPEYKVKLAEFRKAYEAYCKLLGEQRWTDHAMGPYLVSRGFTKKMSNGTWYVGLRLRENVVTSLEDDSFDIDMGEL